MNSQSLFGAIRFGGPDARTFLQGQLTNDLRLLGPAKPMLAALCNPQGRAFALLELFEDAAGIIALLPASMVEPTIARLRKYLLRAKATIESASGELPQLAATIEAAGISEANSNAWRLKQIAAGRPQIYPETSELFVAQMLNLDALGAVSFDKGCYTGQEIIARAHYRGQVKRRMLRYRTAAGSGLQRGSSVRVDRGRDGKIVEIAALPDGSHEFLAVAPLTGTDDTKHVTPATEQPSNAAEVLPLPYPIPDSDP